MNNEIINKVTNYLVAHFGLVGEDGLLVDLDDNNMPCDRFIKIYNRSMSEVKEFRYRALIDNECFSKFMFEIFYIRSDMYDLDTVYKYFVNVIEQLHDKLKTRKLRYRIVPKLRPP
jgi:hypothetical protein